MKGIEERVLADTIDTNNYFLNEARIGKEAQIHFGLNKSASEKLKRQALRVLAVMDILPLQAPVDEHYGQIRAYLNRAGQPIGWNGLLIAAHARALDLTLVTENLREFRRVEDLRVENWL